MTTYLYMVDSWDWPTHVQRDAFAGHEIKRSFVDSMNTIGTPFMDRSEGRMLCMILKPCDTVLIYDWAMMFSLSKAEQARASVFLGNRNVSVIDRDGDPCPPDGTHDIMVYLLNQVGIAVPSVTGKRRHRIPGWKETKRRAVPDKKERIYARMLLSLITDYGFNVRDILRCGKDVNMSDQIAAAKYGFPQHHIRDPLLKLEGHWMHARRRAYWKILRVLGDREMLASELTEELAEAHVTFRAGRLFELRTAGAIEYSWSPDRRAYTYKRRYDCNLFNFSTYPFDIVRAVQDEPKTAGELSKQFAEPRWYIVDIMGCPPIRKALSILRNKKGKVYYKLKMPVEEIDFDAVREALKLTSSCSWASRTSRSLGTEDDSAPFDP